MVRPATSWILLLRAVVVQHGGAAAAKGLRARGGGAIEGFALAGPDRVWHSAQARVSGNAIILTSAAVPTAVAVRYAWTNNPRGCNLENDSALPACAFRSDVWPLCISERAAK